MPSGGPGRGQGRKPGSVNVQTKRTREIIEKAAEEGILPLQVMLDNIRFYTREADKLIAELLTGGALPIGDAANPLGESPLLEAIKSVVGLRKLAGEEAARAAQYVHPRQGYAADDAKGDDHVPLAERIAHYQRRDDIEAAGAKVVELKPTGK